MNIEIEGLGTKLIANNILTNVDNLNSSIKKLDSVVDKINEAWKSDISEEYVNVMREKNIPELKKISEVLEMYGNYLNNVPGAYELLDEIFTEKSMEF